LRNGGKVREKPPLAIAVISRQSVSDIDRSSIGARRGREVLANLRPGVVGLTVHRAPVIAPTPS